MIDDLAIAGRAAHGVRIAQVAGDDFHGGAHIGRQQRQQPRILAGVVAHKGADVQPFAHQPLDQVAADETAGPGDKYLHMLSFINLPQRRAERVSRSSGSNTVR